MFIYNKRKRDEEAEKNLGVRYSDLDTLFKESDVVTLHVPLTDETRHMINKETLNKMKKGSFLVNTARGGLIETNALVNALDLGILAGAGLDVLEDECLIKEDAQVMSKHFPKKCNMKIILEDHILAKKDNVIITPHNAFNSKEALQRILDTTVLNIKGFINNKAVNKVNVVDARRHF